MKCNQRFFGQEHFEAGTVERAFCSRLRAFKPLMAQYEFALRDHLPPLPHDVGGLVQVKFNGMLSLLLWDEPRGGFVAWNPRGRCYYSLPPSKAHPVTAYFNRHFSALRDHVFIGETYVVRLIQGRSYMTPFNRSMSIIKNPRSLHDLQRIRLAVFDYAQVTDATTFTRPQPQYLDRFSYLREVLQIPVGCDAGVVHLPDCLDAEGSFAEHADALQRFWDAFIRIRGFEGLVLHTTRGDEYKLKFRDTLDVVILAFRLTGASRPVCAACGVKFDVLWLRKAAQDGLIKRSDYFDGRGRLLRDPTHAWIRDPALSTCPICDASLTRTAGPKLGAKIALMTSAGEFVDVADGAQFSPLSPLLNRITPLYEADGYLWVHPDVVIEVSYQELYVNSPRPLYRYEDGHYVRVGTMNAVSLRPYKPQLREDKTVTPMDLRLDQVAYLVQRVRRIAEGGGPLTE